MHVHSNVIVRSDPEVQVMEDVSRKFLVGRILTVLDSGEHGDGVIWHPGEDGLTHGALPSGPSDVQLSTFNMDALERVPRVNIN